MFDFKETVFEDIKAELRFLFAAHKAVGLEGEMCLYTLPHQEIWRAEESGKVIWFGPDKVDEVVKTIEEHYNKGKLPNSPMLLSPVIHHRKEGAKHPVPVGSGFAWSTSLCLGIQELTEDCADRMKDLGAICDVFHRGEESANGLKILALSDKPLHPTKEDGSVEGCRELFEVANINSVDYYPYYLLSGMEYLSKNGIYGSPSFEKILRSQEAYDKKQPAEGQVDKLQMPLQRMKDAALCWHAYDNHHSLFKRFGIDAKNLDRNLVYYNLCGRDFELLDATGPKHVDADTEVTFDFLVDGWVARGAVTIIGATGGTGKSSLAHNLAVKAAIDWDEDEQPTWLGKKINKEKCNGIIVYFSGEDGPAIVHSRAKVYDPKGRANRLMFQRTDFGEGVDLDGFLARLYKMPEVPLIVIDPARKYLTGDENDAGIVSDFFEAIEEFAINKNTAMVVVHHLAKGAKPAEVAEIYDLLRGSQVFIDRPRAVIGMIRKGPDVVAGLAKNNIPPQLGMIRGERVYRRDADSLELVKYDGRKGITNTDLTEEEIEKILAEEAKEKAELDKFPIKTS